MLEVVIGSAVVLLVLTGLAIMLGPNLLRLREVALRARRAIPEPPVIKKEGPPMNPSTQKVVSSTMRLGSMLRAYGQNDLAERMREALRNLQEDEARGLLRIQSVLRQVRELALSDERAHHRLHQLARELRRDLADRAEQLELILL